MIGGFSVPNESLCLVAFDAPAILQAGAEAALGARVPLLGGQALPVHRGHGVAPNTMAVVVQEPEGVLSLAITSTARPGGPQVHELVHLFLISWGECCPRAAAADHPGLDGC